MKNIIIVTGANRGLGKAIVDLVLKDNDNLIVSLSRSLNEEHKQIDPERLIFIETDLSKPFSEERLENIYKYTAVNSTLYFFNNACIITPIKKIGEFEESKVETSLKVNIEFPVKLINYLQKHFINSYIKLINITSGAGIKPIAYWALYGASKAYMKLFFQVLEIEQKDNGKFKIYNVDPGTMDTGMQKEIREASFPQRSYFQTLNENNQLIKPSDAALKILNEINFWK